MNFTEAVNLAKAGEESGFGFLYQNTYKSKYYLALQYTKNEDLAQDVLQDAYMTAFSKLDTLKDPESFSAWLGKIVANTAINASKKKNPLLFSDVAAEQENENFEYQIEDDNLELQPEIAYTRQETKELVHELLDSLSEEQKMCMLLFHIEGISIREIAELMNCSENTVKSRLNYGRKNLKIKAEELQKKGYKLYSIAPLPLLLYLLRTDAEFMQADGAFSAAGQSMAEQIFENVSAKSGGTVHGAQNASEAFAQTASHAAAKTAAGAAKAGLFHTAAGKAAAVILGACVVGGGAFGVYQVTRSDPQPRPVQEETQSEEEDVKEDQIPERTQVKDEDYPELIAGNLTKEELEFVFAYGPEEIPEGGIENSIQFPYLLPMLCEGGGRGEGPVEYYGVTDIGQVAFSMGDLNRLLLSFTPYQYSEADSTDTEYGIHVDGDRISYPPVTVNFTASSKITSAEYSGDKLEVFFTLERLYATGEGDVHADKKAVLALTEDGLYRIVSIEDAVQVNTADAETGEVQAGKSGNTSASVKEAYTAVLRSVAAHELGYEFAIAGDVAERYQYFLCDMDKDGIEELIVAAYYPEQAFYYYDCRIFTFSADTEVGIQAVGDEFVTLSLVIPSEGDGVFTADYTRGTGMYDINRIRIREGRMESVSECEFRMGDEAEQQFRAENSEPVWKDISDFSGLDSLS